MFVLAKFFHKLFLPPLFFHNKIKESFINPPTITMALPPHFLASLFGILGNIVSFMVYLAPLPTFIRIYKRKSTEGFQSIPYSVALFSAMLLLYYANLKTENGTMLITINSIGCAIETTYILLFLLYATKDAMKYTMKLVMVLNVGAYGLIVTTTFLLTQGPQRVTVVGWICAVFSVCVFAAPLSIMRLVIKTKSVEYMPFSLSLSLTVCAVIWFFYGLSIKDYYVATPNVLGFVFGIAQMILYVIYNDRRQQILPIIQQQEIQEKKVVDLGVVLEMQDKSTVNLGAILEMQEKAGVDLGVVLEMQDKSAVDLGAILEMQEKAGVDLGVILEIQEKAAAELGVNLETPEKPVAGEAEPDADKQDDVAKVCLDRVQLDGEMPIMPIECVA